MTRYINPVFILVLLLALLTVLAGCERPKSVAPVPTQVAQSVTGTAPAATGMPTPVPTKSVVTTSPAPTSPIATPTVPPPSPTPRPIVPSPLPTTAPSGQTTYTVKPGEWLWKIARELGVSPQAIVAANPGLDINLLRPGQQLIIPAPGTPTAATPVPGGTGQVTHTVQKGDTLFSIARKYNKPVQAIATANGLTNINLIYVGQILVIP